MLQVLQQKSPNRGRFVSHRSVHRLNSSSVARGHSTEMLPHAVRVEFIAITQRGGRWRWAALGRPGRQLDNIRMRHKILMQLPAMLHKYNNTIQYVHNFCYCINFTNMQHASTIKLFTIIKSHHSIQLSLRRTGEWTGWLALASVASQTEISSASDLVHSTWH